MKHHLPVERAEKLHNALDLISEGADVETAAEKIGVSRSTLYRWLSTDDALTMLQKRTRLQLSVHTPELLSLLMDRARNKKTPAMAVMKAFEAVSSKAGYADAREQEEVNKGQLAIQINLGDKPAADP